MNATSPRNLTQLGPNPTTRTSYGTPDQERNMQRNHTNPRGINQSANQSIEQQQQQPCQINEWIERLVNGEGRRARGGESSAAQCSAVSMTKEEAHRPNLSPTRECGAVRSPDGRQLTRRSARQQKIGDERTKQQRP